MCETNGLIETTDQPDNCIDGAIDQPDNCIDGNHWPTWQLYWWKPLTNLTIVLMETTDKPDNCFDRKNNLRLDGLYVDYVWTLGVNLQINIFDSCL